MLLTAAAYANNLVYLLTFFLTAIFLLAMAETNRNLKGVVLHRVEVEPGPRGGEVNYQLWLKNRGPKASFSLFVEARQPPEQRPWDRQKGRQKSGRRKRKLFPFSRAVGPAGEIPRLSPKALGQAQFSVPVTKRGVFPLHPLRLCTIFPLGLFYSWKRLDPQGEYFVYPRPRGSQALPPPRALETWNPPKPPVPGRG